MRWMFVNPRLDASRSGAVKRPRHTGLLPSGRTQPGAMASRERPRLAATCQVCNQDNAYTALSVLQSASSDLYSQLRDLILSFLSGKLEFGSGNKVFPPLVKFFFKLFCWTTSAAQSGYESGSSGGRFLYIPKESFMIQAKLNRLFETNCLCSCAVFLWIPLSSIHTYPRFFPSWILCSSSSLTSVAPLPRTV